MSRVPQPGVTLTITPWEGSGCKPGSHLVQAPSRIWETRGLGTLRGLGGDSRSRSSPPPHPPSRRECGMPRALEIPRAPRNAERLPGNQEKNFCFFFLFWHSLYPRTLLLVLAPRGTPPRGTTDADQSIALWVRQWAGRTATEDTPYFSVYKRWRPRLLAQIADAGNSFVSFVATWIIFAENFAIFSRFFGEDFAAFRRSGKSAQAPWEGFGPSCFGFSIFSFGTVVGLLSTVDYNCNMTLEELVACDNAAQK